MSNNEWLQARHAKIVAKALNRIATRLNFSSQQLGAIVGAADVETCLMHRELGEAALENALLLVQLHSLLTGIGGDGADAAASWLKSYNVALEACPIELAQQRAGLKRVVDYLASRSCGSPA